MHSMVGWTLISFAAPACSGSVIIPGSRMALLRRSRSPDPEEGDLSPRATRISVRGTLGGMSRMTLTVSLVPFDRVAPRGTRGHPELLGIDPALGGCRTRGSGYRP